MQRQETGGYRSGGAAPVPRHSNCDSAGEQASIGRDEYFRHPDRRQHRGGNVAQRPPEERRRLDTGRKQQERRPQEVSHDRHADQRRPDVHTRRRSRNKPVAMPVIAAAATERRSGSPCAAITVMPAASAAPTMARSRSIGTDSAMKASGAANSRRQDAGTPAPMTMPASTASCHASQISAPAPRT